MNARFRVYRREMRATIRAPAFFKGALQNLRFCNAPYKLQRVHEISHLAGEPTEQLLPHTGVGGVILLAAEGCEGFPHLFLHLPAVAHAQIIEGEGAGGLQVVVKPGGRDPQGIVKDILGGLRRQAVGKQGVQSHLYGKG